MQKALSSKATVDNLPFRGFIAAGGEMAIKIGLLNGSWKLFLEKSTPEFQADDPH